MTRHQIDFPFNAAESASLMIPNRLFSASSLMVPSGLHDLVLRAGFRPERQTAIYLIYDAIAANCKQMKDKWTPIPDSTFRKLVKNHTRKSAEKKWLEENGFIQIKKWRSNDGSIKNSKIPGKLCQAYKLVEQEGECVWVDLWGREIAWPSSTAGDRFSQYARKVLTQLEVDPIQLSRMCNGDSGYSVLPPARRIAILYWARVLHFGAGSIRRGRRVNRLFSPWTSAPRELRRVCRLSGEAIVSIDLQASQPTLIGLLAQDDSFVKACFNDELYTQIGELFATNRDEAKPIFLSYVYGPNREANARNKLALAVQHYVAERFPTTHAYIWQEKRRDYKAFARQLQNYEARLFLDGILAEMEQRGIPALTAHDSIAVPESQGELALQISRDVLAELAGKGRLKMSNYGSMEEKAIAV
jgi:hypothetical protein